MKKQITIRNEVSCNGIGLHSGRQVNLTIKPAEENSGIIFVRVDLENKPQIRAVAENVTATLRATTLSSNGAKVFTIEHLMSALHVLNCIIELDAEEPPVLNGNAIDFFKVIRSAGIIEQSAIRNEVIIDKVYRIDDTNTEGRRFIMALPYNGFRVSFTSVNPHKLIGVQYVDFDIDIETYEKEIAPARTIAYELEIEQLRKAGLGLGGNLENVIVYNDEGWLNKLNYSDELVRHKVLDAIGDLRLAGIMRGHIIAASSGHSLNTKLAKLISSDKQGGARNERTTNPT